MRHGNLPPAGTSPAFLKGRLSVRVDQSFDTTTPDFDQIAYEALHNGFLSCAEPEKLQQICDSLGPERRQINRRLLEIERVSHNGGLSGDRIRRVVQPAVTEDG